MRFVNPALTNQLKAEEYRPAILIMLQLGATTFRFTSWSSNILFGADIYYPRGMLVGSIKYGSSSIVDNVSIKIDDVDRDIYFSLEAISSTSGSPVDIFLTVLDSSNAPIAGATTNIFTGTLGEWAYRPGEVSIKSVSIFNQWGRVTTGKFSGSCRWRVFKGSYCKYSGSAVSCDRTYEYCDSISNTVNFGGFRWLPALQGKTIKLD